VQEGVVSSNTVITDATGLHHCRPISVNTGRVSWVGSQHWRPTWRPVMSTRQCWSVSPGH